MDFEAIKKAAEGYKPAMVKFLRDMIAIPSESCEEEGVVKRIAEELKALGYDKVEFDKLGNVIGWMGDGDKIIAIDSHIDTVGIGNIDNWEADPYKGYETDDIIYGRGGSDQEGGMAAAAYGVKIMKDLDLLPKGYKMMVVGSVQEEDCDGMCWQSIVNEYFNGPEDAREKIEFVISTEPTDGGIYRGHRGRMEIRVDMHGVSCHGSAPERGDNAIHKMAEVIENVRDLNENPADDSVEIKGLVKMLDPKYNPEHYEDARFLGRGTCTTSQIFYTSPSRCAVAVSYTHGRSMRDGHTCTWRPSHPWHTSCRRADPRSPSGRTCRSHRRSYGGRWRWSKNPPQRSGRGRYRRSGWWCRCRGPGNGRPHSARDCTWDPASSPDP